MIETAIFTSPDGGGTRWRLQGAVDSPADSWHYVHLRFDVAGGEILGYLILRDTGEEIPLDDVRFDGTHLSFRLPSTLPGGKSKLARGMARVPRFLATLVGDREFRGYYVDESDSRLEPAIELKLVREKDEVISL